MDLIIFLGLGWEDNDFQNRANFNNIWIQKNITNRPGDKNGLFHVFNHPHVRKANKSKLKNYILNEFPRFSKNKVKKYIETNGITTAKYFIKSDKIEENIRYININLPNIPGYKEEYLNFLKNIN